MSMTLTTTIKLANGTQHTYTVDFSALPVTAQEAIAAYGFGRKINDTANSAAKKAKDEGKDESAAKLAAAAAIHDAIVSGKIGTTQRGPRAGEWQTEAREWARKHKLMIATLKGVKATAEQHRILDAFIAKNDAAIRPIIDGIIAARSAPIDDDLAI